ncbi:hypothetical protein A0H81_10055 [Grifola frondosa]|uniref:Uncharacterized protein n=1 Tax=Grifola frondosa TaxID=5627 RepID=A0A1C7LZQ4_GRIFR|nr:hypothetical protein A0H81_10055 [Grifola frondosa]
MIEPKSPVTLVIEESFSEFPVFFLESDEGVPLSPSSVILRHRHLDPSSVTVSNPIPTAIARNTNISQKSKEGDVESLPARSSVSLSYADLEQYSPPSVSSASVRTALRGYQSFYLRGMSTQYEVAVM